MVTLVGAGPGDAGLLTVKGLKRIMDADVVLYDRLVGEDIIAMIPDKAEKINVGKNAGSHPVPQNDINTLLLTKAKDGLNVVRLKGGDPFIFGRGGEELEQLAENNIEFEVVPGVSVSAAGGAYAGIPVTHRDFTSSVHIITGHARHGGELNIDYDSLVKLNGTIVFMMSVSSLQSICKGLITAGMDADMPAAVIENATTPLQRTFTGNISSINSIAKENSVVSPAVIIVGKVCSLADKLNWFTNKPLFGKRIMVTRARAGASALSASLRELGCIVAEAPCIRIESLINANNMLLKSAVDNISNYSWLVFTSAAGVNLFFEYLADMHFDIRKLHHIKLAAVGTETKNAIEKLGIYVDYIPPVFNGVELAKGLLPLLGENDKILMPRAKAGSKDITDIFNENGILCDDIPIYDTMHETSSNEEIKDMLLNNEIDAVTFTSSSTVEGFVKVFEGVNFEKVTGICIGELTEKTAKKYGINTCCSKNATIDSLIEKIKEVL